jgi:DNA topoisomerase-1
MEKTYIRIGNNGYEKLYGSYGLTTLKNKHVAIKGNSITFSFKGKKGIYHNITLKSKRFSRIIKQCKAIPGRELFQYYDESEVLRKVDSGQVNHYIKDCLQQDFTTKDFRTWAGTLMMLRILKSAAPCLTSSDHQKNLMDAFREVSKKLGNTVAVCKKYYVHPQLVDLYERDKLSALSKSGGIHNEHKSGLTNDERLLMKLLRVIQRQNVTPRSTDGLLKNSIKKEIKTAKKRDSRLKPL